MGLACLCASPVHAQSLLTLTELAQQHDASWQSVRAKLEATIHQGAQTKAGLLPKIGAQASSQRQETRVTTDIAPVQRHAGAQHAAAIQASQALYAPAQLATYRQGQHIVQAAYAQTDAAGQDLLVRTAQAYFAVLQAQDTFQLVHAQKQAVQEQLAFAQRNFEIGTATVTDMREAQARHDLISAQEIAATNDLQVQRMALEQLVGRQEITPWTLQQPVQLPVIDPSHVQAWVDEALAHNPLIRQARIAVEVAELEIDKAQAGHKPTVELQASYGTQRNPDGSLATPYRANTYSGNVGVVMNVPLFAGFAVQNRVRETVSLLTQARADLEDVTRQVTQAVRTAFYGLQSGYGQVQALEAAVASSQSALEANRLGYEVGVRINMDVLNAQSQVFEAQKNLAQARYQVLLGHLQLRQAAGVLEMTHVQTINDLLTPAVTAAQHNVELEANKAS